MRTAPGLVVAGKYKLEDLVGKGGMGEVWRAFDQSLERPVALKFISDEVLERASVRLRFTAEAKAAARLRTPYVVSIFEHGLVDDTPFIAMELLDGEDLRVRLKRRRRLSVPEVCAIIDQMAQGLRVAHAEGIVHRDLKPGNVFLAREGDRETVKLLDFGVAKLDEGRPSELTATGEMVGSIYYMSPEQVRGSRDLDGRADIWSLGVICYRALTGKLPFKGDSIGDVAVNICTSEAKPPSALRSELPADLDDFFRQALAIDPDHRFRTATALAEALVVCCGRELHTGPPSSSGPSMGAALGRDPSHYPPTPVPADSGVKARSTLGYSPDPKPGGLVGARSTIAYGPDHAAIETPGLRSTFGYGAQDERRSTMGYSPDPQPGGAGPRAAAVVRAPEGELPQGRATALAHGVEPLDEPDDGVATRVAPKSSSRAESGIALNRADSRAAVSEPPRPFADTVASGPGEDEDDVETSLDLEEPVESIPQPRRPSPSAAVVPDLELPARRSSAPSRAPRAAPAPAAATAPKPAAKSPARRVSAAPVPEVRPIAPAVAAMRAGTSGRPALQEQDGPSVEPAMVRRLVGAAVAVALGAAASSVVGVGLMPVVPAVLAVLSLVGAALLWRQAEVGAVQLSAIALAVVGLTAGAAAIPSAIGGEMGTLAVVASAAAAVVALGLSVAGARTVKAEFERHVPQGILIVLMVLLGVAVTAQLARRAAMATEAPPVTAR